MAFEFSCYTDPGRRDNNEDCFRAQMLGETLLAAVADGLGGHANGEVASAMTMDVLFDRLAAAREIDDEEVIYGLLDANTAILRSGIHGHSTAAALWAREDYAVAVHVGDSRIYQFRDNRILFQSMDHSHVQMAVLVGELDLDDVRHHKDRNKLFRVLGDPESIPKADSRELSVCPGDRFLLCTDGFWEAVTEEHMLRTLRNSESAADWLESMKQIVVNTNDPRQDNHTAICVFVT